ncbi:unnamed protein product [Coccothraustes coccothraustes]
MLSVVTLSGADSVVWEAPDRGQEQVHMGGVRQLPALPPPHAWSRMCGYSVQERHPACWGPKHRAAAVAPGQGVREGERGQEGGKARAVPLGSPQCRQMYTSPLLPERAAEAELILAKAVPQ